eukprot:TRINITY_DN1075_c0_g1_i1.p1 TRINITY_DN1075_c0_g1~~TRINITY_DN1075_c0_g1_i1.p1  ORF type:complete len:453 (-),score=158.06 TRINITY_DN1075_c0_g1_i1:43-1362(-)
MEEIQEDQIPQNKKIVIITSGSRGDCQPFIALGLGLKDLGYKVVLATEERLRQLVEGFGLAFFKIAGDPTNVLFTEEGQKWLAEGKIRVMMNKMNEEMKPYFEQTLMDYEMACEDADLIISAPLCYSQTYSIAEKMKVPWIPVLLGPSIPTREFALPFLTSWNLFGFLNKFTYSLLFKMMWLNEKSRINNWREKTLQIPAISESRGIIDIIEKRHIDVICGFDEQLIPTLSRPADWAPEYRMIGYLFVPEVPDSEIDPKLLGFMEIGSPPVFLGFGSMPAPGKDGAQRLLNMALQISRNLKLRVVLAMGWTDIDKINTDEISDDVLVVKSVPHSWIFPRSLLTVHHCGVGTVAALASGVPCIACPIYLDQPANAQQLFRLGMSPAPIPFSQLTSDTLTSAVKEVLNSELMKKRAKEVKMEVDKKDGVANAIAIVKKFLC